MVVHVRRKKWINLTDMQQIQESEKEPKLHLKVKLRLTLQDLAGFWVSYEWNALMSAVSPHETSRFGPQTLLHESGWRCRETREVAWSSAPGTKRWLPPQGGRETAVSRCPGERKLNNEKIQLEKYLTGFKSLQNNSDVFSCTPINWQQKSWEGWD